MCIRDSFGIITANAATAKPSPATRPQLPPLQRDPQASKPGHRQAIFVTLQRRISTYFNLQKEQTQRGNRGRGYHRCCSCCCCYHPISDRLRARDANPAVPYPASGEEQRRGGRQDCLEAEDVVGRERALVRQSTQGWYIYEQFVVFTVTRIFFNTE